MPVVVMSVCMTAITGVVLDDILESEPPQTHRLRGGFPTQVHFVIL